MISGHCGCEVVELASKTTKACAFPFTYKGKERYGCVIEDANPDADAADDDDDANADEKFWCSTDPSSSGEENRF